MLYLLRHGEADANDTLTERGIAGVERIAEWAARAGIVVSEIRHSGKHRAEQTAAIVGARLQPPHGVQRIAGIQPNDDPIAFAQSLHDDESVLVVSHLPFLAHLTATLVGSDQPIVDFHPATLVALARVVGGWVIDAVVHPRIA